MPGWIRVDVNQDGIIDQLDIEKIKSHLGESSASGIPVSISSGSLPSGRVGVAYNAILVAAGGSGQYSWFRLAGSLPTGLSLSNYGVISGTPAAPGNYTFIVEAIDAEDSRNYDTRTYTLVIGTNNTVTISLSPDVSTVSAGGTFEVNLLIDAGDTVTAGIDFNISFDPAQLEYGVGKKAVFIKIGLKATIALHWCFPSRLSTTQPVKCLLLQYLF